MDRGITLIETLVVLVLLGMLAGVGAVALAGASTQANIMAIYTDVLDLDGKARSASLGGESVLMKLHDHRVELVSMKNKESLASRSLKPSLDLQWLDGTGFEYISTLRFNSRGQTRDFQLAIGVEGESSPRKQWTISGLTGWPEPMR